MRLNTEDDLNGEDDVPRRYLSTPKSPIGNSSTSSLEQSPKKIKIDCKLNVKELRFSDGVISFNQHVPQVSRTINFEINQTSIRKEFESVKHYFPKALGLTKFSISIDFEIFNRDVQNVKYDAPELDRINDSLFRKIESEILHIKIGEKGNDEIFTIQQLAEEISKSFEEHELGAPGKLLEHLISEKRTKHHYHLGYLAKKHIATNMNLCLTGNPLSFIFIVHGEPGFVVVWETYETDEATYLWKIDSKAAKQTAQQFDYIVKKISWLRQGNKKQYLSTQPKDFKRIEHDYSGHDLGFRAWQSQLESFITGL